MKGFKKALLCMVLVLSFAMVVPARTEAAESTEYEAQKKILEELVEALDYDATYSDYFTWLYEQNYDAVLQLQEYQTTNELAAFFFACTYFRGTLGDETYGYWIGDEGIQALQALEKGDAESFQSHMEKSLEYYNDTPGSGSTQSDAADPTVIGAGIYIVGEDIPAGKYDVAAINGSGGKVSFYSNYENYKNDGAKDSYYFLYAEDSRYYKQGDSTVASNVRLEEGNCIEVESGLELQFTMK